MRIVIDTNVLLATIGKKNFERFVYEAFKEEQFEWVVSTEILKEYEEMLIDFYSVETAGLVLGILENAHNVIFEEPAFRWALIVEDPDDNKFSDLALSTNANYMLTRDKHFNIFKKIDFPSLNVVNPEEFLEILKKLKKQ